MAKKKTILPLGTKAYAVSKTWVDKEVQAIGAKILPCKIATYINEGGKVLPQYKASEGKSYFTETSHYVFYNLEEAVEIIKSKPKKK